MDESHVIWINYNRSFRMPLYSEINSGFTNLNSGYQTVSNPDLKPETGDVFEVGLRARHDHVRYGFTGYYGIYNNFIEGGRFVGTNCDFEGGRCIAQYQTVNADQAIIYGVEGIAEYSTVPDGYGFKIRTGFNYTVGDNIEDDQPLTTIDPAKAIIAVGYHEPSDGWKAELIGTAFGRARVPEDSILFIPSSYVRWDLVGSWSVTSKFRINFGVLNLFDYKQYSYSDTKYILDTGYRDMSGFSLPGRSYQLGFSLRLS
jgi:hemoglobin/transferrin/lactoferrin receptor protein